MKVITKYLGGGNGSVIIAENCAGERKTLQTIRGTRHMVENTVKAAKEWGDFFMVEAVTEYVTYN